MQLCGILSTGSVPTHLEKNLPNNDYRQLTSTADQPPALPADCPSLARYHSAYVRCCWHPRHSTWSAELPVWVDSVEKLQILHEWNNFSRYEEFYLFRYEGAYEMPHLSSKSLIFTHIKDLNCTIEKNALWLKFGFLWISSFSTLSAKVWVQVTCRERQVLRQLRRSPKSGECRILAGGTHLLFQSAPWVQWQGTASVCSKQDV